MIPPRRASPTPSDAFLSDADSDLELRPLDRRTPSPESFSASPLRRSDSLSSRDPFDLDEEDVVHGDNDDWHLLGRGKGGPLEGKSHAKLAAMGRAYAERELMLRDEEEIRCFELGAVAAGVLEGRSVPPGELQGVYGDIEGLEESERRALVGEGMRKWRQPFMLYYVVVSAWCRTPGGDGMLTVV